MTDQSTVSKLYYAAGGEVNAVAISGPVTGAMGEFQDAFAQIFDRWRGNPEQVQMSDAAKKRLDLVAGGVVATVTNQTTGRSVAIERCGWLPSDVAVLVEGAAYRCPTCKGIVRPER